MVYCQSGKLLFLDGFAYAIFVFERFYLCISKSVKQILIIIILILSTTNVFHLYY